MWTYVNPTSVLGSSIALPTIATLTVVLRFISRRTAVQGYGVDDWMSIPALIFTWGVAACMIHGATHGAIGGHTEAADLRDPRRLPIFIEHNTVQGKLDYSLIPLSVVAMGCIRLTILFLFRRVFCGRVVQTCTWILIGLVSAWTVTFTIGMLLACGTHSSEAWMPTRKHNEYCTPTAVVQAGMAISDIILDLCVLALPVYPVLILQMKAQKKATIIGLFLLGAFATACGLVRTVFITAISRRNLGLLGVPLYDVQGVTSLPEFWTMIEVGVACITANLPALPGILKTNFAQRLRSWTSGRSTPNLGGDSGKKAKELSVDESV